MKATESLAIVGALSILTGFIFAFYGAQGVSSYTNDDSQSATSSIGLLSLGVFILVIGMIIIYSLLQRNDIPRYANKVFDG